MAPLRLAGEFIPIENRKQDLTRMALVLRLKCLARNELRRLLGSNAGAFSIAFLRLI